MIFLRAATPANAPVIPGYTKPIQLFTISNANDLLFIAYDENPVFAYLKVTPPPLATLGLTVTVDDPNTISTIIAKSGI